MRRIVTRKKGGLEVLKIEEVRDLLPTSGEVRIAVKAAGINFADVMVRMGSYPNPPVYPCTVGYEVSGIIDKVSSDVDSSWLGKEVVAITKFNGQAEQVNVPIDQVYEKPPNMSFEQGAAFLVNYITAYQILIAMGGLQSNESVLIHNVGGGVGLAALEIAKHIGAKTFGTASSHKHAFLTKQGLDHAIDYTKQNWKEEVMKLTGGRGLDFVMDPIGGKNLKLSFLSLSSTGRVALFGLSSAAVPGIRGKFEKLKMLIQTPVFHAIQLLVSNKGIFGVNTSRLWHEKKKINHWVEALVNGQKEGWINPYVDRIFTFDQIAEAHQYIESRKNIGKVVLVP